MIEKIIIIIQKIKSKIPSNLGKKLYLISEKLLPRRGKELKWIVLEKIIPYDKLILDRYIDWHKKLVGNEIELAGIKKNHKVLNIGCGSIPATCIFVHKATNAELVGIDNDPSAVKKALKILKIMNLSDKIEIKNEDAINCNVKEFDIILISRGIVEIEKVLKHISINSKKDVVIVARLFPEYEERSLDKLLTKTNFYKIDKKCYGEFNSILIRKKK